MHKEQLKPEQLEAIRSSVAAQWIDIQAHPERLSDLSEQKLVFAAGGGLVTRFGTPDSQIWQGLVTQAKDGMTSIAGIEFSLDDLHQMGAFYRFLQSKGYVFHCIDERLEGDLEHLTEEVHEACGACAAVSAASGLQNVENALLDELGQKAKQEINRNMPNHDSMVVLVDLRGSDVVLGGMRESMRDSHALPFNVSLPLDQIKAFAENDAKAGARLVSTLVKWNVQIARNIIGGHHNDLAELAESTVIVVDQRGVSPDPFIDSVLDNIAQVQHGQLMSIV